MVPIDEVQAIGIKTAPTYSLDEIKSVTLKAFRKVVGYDTFDSILKKDRNEKKDPADYYNVTVAMMIKRNPASQATFTKDTFEGGKTLGQVIDKGFPYDDGDIDIGQKMAQASTDKSGAAIVGKLNGENITKGNLKNLITDKTVPVTDALIQIPN